MRTLFVAAFILCSTLASSAQTALASTARVKSERFSIADALTFADRLRCHSTGRISLYHAFDDEPSDARTHERRHAFESCGQVVSADSTDIDAALFLADAAAKLLADSDRSDKQLIEAAVAALLRIGDKRVEARTYLGILFVNTDHDEQAIQILQESASAGDPVAWTILTGIHEQRGTEATIAPPLVVNYDTPQESWLESYLLVLQAALDRDSVTSHEQRLQVASKLRWSPSARAALAANRELAIRHWNNGEISKAVLPARVSMLLGGEFELAIAVSIFAESLSPSLVFEAATLLNRFRGDSEEHLRNAWGTAWLNILEQAETSLFPKLREVFDPYFALGVALRFTDDGVDSSSKPGRFRKYLMATYSRELAHLQIALDKGIADRTAQEHWAVSQYLRAYAVGGNARSSIEALGLAARAGHPDAIWRVAQMLLADDPTNPAHHQQVHRAATLGVGDAALYIARQYLFGNGVAQDIDAAREYYKLAEQNGSLVAPAESRALDLRLGFAISPHIDGTVDVERAQAYIDSEHSEFRAEAFAALAYDLLNKNHAANASLAIAYFQRSLATPSNARRPYCTLGRLLWERNLAKDRKDAIDLFETGFAVQDADCLQDLMNVYFGIAEETTDATSRLLFWSNVAERSSNVIARLSVAENLTHGLYRARDLGRAKSILSSDLREIASDGLAPAWAWLGVDTALRLAEIAVFQGQYQSALAYIDAAKAAAHLEQQRELRGRSLMEIAILEGAVAFEIQDRALANRKLTEAREIAERFEVLDTSDLEHYEAVLLKYTDPERARKVQPRPDARIKRGQEPAYYADDLADYAGTLLLAGKCPAARRYALKSLSVLSTRHQAGGNSAAILVDAFEPLAMVGMCALGTSDHKVGVALLERVLRISELVWTHPDIATQFDLLLVTLSLLHNGEYQLALQFSDLAVSAIKQLRTQEAILPQFQSAAEQALIELVLLQRIQISVEMQARGLLSDSQLHEQAVTALFLLRSSGLSAAALQHRLAQEVGGESLLAHLSNARRLDRRVAAFRNHIERYGTLDRGQAVAMFSEATSLAEISDVLWESHLATMSLVPESPSAVSWVQSRLLPQTALLAMSLGPVDAVLTLVTTEEVHVEVLKSSAERIRDLATTVRTTNKPGKEVLASSNDLLKALADFGQLTLGRLGPETTHVLLMLDNELSDMPFSAFVLDPSADSFSDAYRRRAFAIQRMSIEVLPSLLLLESSAAPDNPRLPTRVLGVGNPTYASLLPNSLKEILEGLTFRAAETAKAVSQLAPLPETSEEITEIAAYFADRTLLLGAEATAEAFLQNVDKDFSHIVFATHGLVPGEIADLTEPALALTPSAASDGLLRASSIRDLSLNADLVSLSACNTASALGGRESDVYSGLAQAFVQAGAKAVLVSLWPVVSEVAKSINVEFYRSLLRDQAVSTSAALQQAVLRNLAMYNSEMEYHPSYWAPFVIVSANR